MLARLDDRFRDKPEGREAEAILKACVHCGFCTAACPTYRLLGDERDGPRGRIYLIKSMLEGEPATERTRNHLDRCLSCRACESACPSGVRYGRLADIARGIVEERAPRPGLERFKRKLLRMILPYPARLAPWVGLARRLCPLLPPALRRKLLPAAAALPWPPARHPRTMLALGGCVQSVLAPSIDAAAARVLDRLGISLIRISESGCCGALSYHLGAHEEGLDFMRRNVDAWWPAIEAGAEAIVITASGCGVMVKEYGELLRDDPAYAEKAARVSALARDLSEAVAAEDWRSLPAVQKRRIAFQSPCTLQHGQRLNGLVEELLQGLGFELTPVADAAVCCGSAGTYSLLQPALSSRLREDKLRNLEAGDPDVIATANIGCLAHLASGTGRPVRHWVELLDRCY
ncbi:glycolate oxidase subunit GlcF [Methylococcus sp. ANG]|uniref:glycolate oxidase subunit GlcF n=1 Tax=Methylococcus sp. ANG TaxID=3231903 RepID=UPI00345B3C21